MRKGRNGRSGAEGSRTLDLLNAIQALSQLSYGPTGGRNPSRVAPIARRHRQVNQFLAPALKEVEAVGNHAKIGGHAAVNKHLPHILCKPGWGASTALTAVARAAATGAGG